MTNMTNKISFMKEKGRDFTIVLREKVYLFFHENQISTRANVPMVLKSVFLMCLVLINYFLILSNIAGGIGFFLLNILFGFFISIGTMNIAHDALHGAYTSNSFCNRALGLLMDLSGASSFYWKKGHAIDHHTFTNIAEHDEDLGATFFLRLCPKARYFWFHRFQHFYAPFLYCLNLMHWVYLSDFKRIFKIIKLKNEAPGNPSNLEIFLLIAFKCIHLFLFLVLPIMVLPYAWWVVVLGYLTFLAAAGITITTVFQLAHIVENVAFPLPNKEGKIENSFVKHQLSTTSNFSMNSRLITFLFGGLNFQIEHHIFPHICHVHLPKIAHIVRGTAKEFGLIYHENLSFVKAIRSHFRTLKKLGQNP